MSDLKLPTVNQRLYFEIFFSEKSGQQKNHDFSYELERQNAPSPQAYLIAFIFPSENRSEMYCKKMQIQGGRLAIFSAKTS